MMPKDIASEKFIDAIYYSDYLANVLGKERRVFFSEQDVDFADVNNDTEEDNEPVIEYIKKDNPNVLGLSVNVPSDGFLVRLENFHSGWRAFIDGIRTKVYRANYAFQAIKIPKGEHRIIFKFSSIYPILRYLHIFCAFLTWLAFNFFLYKISRKK
jgi:uncharacterized membrane protein YfhO